MTRVSVLDRYLGLVKFEHTLFALPFALLSLLVAADGRPSRRVLLLVLVAMVAARSAAMAFNRLVDRRLDAANPRTVDRHLPAGLVSAGGAGLLVLVASGLLVLAAWLLNPLCFVLSPVALLIVLGYSYTKRFTPYSHLVLGLGLAVAPVGAWLAVTGQLRGGVGYRLRGAGRALAGGRGDVLGRGLRHHLRLPGCRLRS